MGHRATFAIRENGQVELFYSHWGALSVPQDVFWGPEATEAYIRANEPDNQWLDDVWGEGGIGLNKDEKILTWYGGETLGYSPHRELFEQLLGALWAEYGWTVRAVDGMPDVAESVGVDRAVAEAAPIDPHPIDPERYGTNWADSPTAYYGLLSIVGDEEVEHRVLDFGLAYCLAGGPRILEYLARFPTLEAAFDRHETRALEDWEVEADRRAPITNQLSEGAVIDTGARQIALFAPRMKEHDVRYLGEVWEGWKVERYHDGFAGHFEHLGARPPERLLETPWWGGEPEDRSEPTEDELLAEIAEILLGERRDPSEFMQHVTEQLEAEHGEVWMNPYAMVTPPDARPNEGREAIFGRALAAVVRTRQLAQ